MNFTVVPRISIAAESLDASTDHKRDRVPDFDRAEKLTTAGSTMVHAKDAQLNTLAPRTWLGSGVIDSYMRLLAIHVAKKKAVWPIDSSNWDQKRKEIDLEWSSRAFQSVHRAPTPP